MTIVAIDGPPKSGKTRIANALRNDQIAHKHGALIVDETTDGGYKELLEKIIVGVELPPAPADPEKIPWKDNATVILVGAKGQAALKEFEKLVPGFSKKLGPLYAVTTKAGT